MKACKSISKNKPCPENEKPGPDTLVLGLGNTIITDDGVGIYIARLIRERLSSSGVLVQEASVGGFELIDLLRGFRRAIIIDAIYTGQNEPGALVRLKPENLQSGSALSRHQISLPEAMGLGGRWVSIFRTRLLFTVLRRLMYLRSEKAVHLN